MSDSQDSPPEPTAGAPQGQDKVRDFVILLVVGSLVGSLILAATYSDPLGLKAHPGRLCEGSKGSSTCMNVPVDWSRDREADLPKVREGVVLRPCPLRASIECSP
jgi:hypothetical protein